MDKYLYWLDCIEGLGANAKRNLMEAFGNAEEVFKSDENMVRYVLEHKKMNLYLEAKKRVDLEKKYEELERQNIKMCSCLDVTFPDKLKVIPDVPFAIYYKGKLPDNKLPAVAVIGARECSQYGEFVAKELGKLLGIQGVQVISGMAKGIDGISQMKAIEEGGPSYAVLGCGVDICYPKSNKKLYEELLVKGGILSTYPPGTSPQARLFPARNRIVSGLADVLVVIEARRRSGTSITVEMALEQGKDIYAVPGRVTDRLSDGCNKMIKEGAHVFLSAEDFLVDLQELLPQKMTRLINNKCEKRSDDLRELPSELKNEKADNSKDKITKSVLDILDYYPQSLDDIAEQLSKKHGIEMRKEELAAKMMYLCILGYVKQDSQGWYSKKG